MPIPSPGASETRADFLDRCMADGTTTAEYPDAGQRFAVCVARWDGQTGTKDMLELLDDLDFWIEQKRLMIQRVQPVFLELFILGALMGANQAPQGGQRAVQVGQRALPQLPFNPDGIANAAANTIGQYSDQWWGMINQTQQTVLRQALLQAEREGLSPDWVMGEIAGEFGENRAELIAVSETTNLMGMGAQESFRQAGYTGWIWRTVRDAVVDPICTALARQSDPQFGGTPFPISRQFMRAHPGCRCFLVPAGDPSAEGMADAMMSPPAPIELGSHAVFQV